MVEGEIEVVVETPRGSRNKYEFDHESQIMRLDRRLFSTMTFPADYGFIPGTLAQDGEALDALVLVEDPTFPGCHIAARPVAIFWMVDEQGPDAKVICVPCHEPRWAGVADFRQLSDDLISEISHFFDAYKDLEPDKETSVRGWQGHASAFQEIAASRERHTVAGSSPVASKSAVRSKRRTIDEH